MRTRETIKELAMRAGLTVNTRGKIGPAGFGPVDDGYKKFAELIVRECGNFTDPVTRNLMMKHFGVGELGDSSCADGGTQCGSINCGH